MLVGIFSNNLDIVEELNKRLSKVAQCRTLYSSEDLFSKELDIVIVDFDTTFNEINQLINDGNIPEKLVVLERNPVNAMGKMLIHHGAVAYGNLQMLTMHLEQLLKSVTEGKIWVYPELLDSIVALVNAEDNIDEALLERLSPQERTITKLVLRGLSNMAIASKLDITTRTAKAHMSSIFSKLHVKDRLALVLLLKS